MERIGRLLQNPRYAALLDEISALEKDRVYCGHGMEHLLSVARIAHILNLEEGLGLPQALVYAAALVHDCGRGRQYIDGTPHEQAGAALGESLLAEAGFAADERARILEAVLHHRKGGGPAGLADILFRADKLSRECFWCAASATCDWNSKDKNRTIRY